jgi:hypothetical protein
VSYEDLTGESWDEDSEAGLSHWIASIRTFAPNVLTPNLSSDTQIRRVYFAIKLNAFNVKPDEASRAHCSGLYSKLALFNHSCNPNCGIQYRTGPDGTPLIRLVALRTIASGEELFISYTNPYVRVSVRRAALKKNFFFDCACIFCSSCENLSSGSFADELLTFCTDDQSPIQFRIKAFSALMLEEVDSSNVVEAAVAILNTAMRLRGQNHLDNDTALDVVNLFVDPEEARLRYIQTASPDLYWQWIVFLTDTSRRIDHASTKMLVELGLGTIKTLYADKISATVLPYISWFESINSTQ